MGFLFHFPKERPTMLLGSVSAHEDPFSARSKRRDVTWNGKTLRRGVAHASVVQPGPECECAPGKNKKMFTVVYSNRSFRAWMHVLKGQPNDEMVNIIGGFPLCLLDVFDSHVQFSCDDHKVSLTRQTTNAWIFMQTAANSLQKWRAEGGRAHVWTQKSIRSSTA